MNPLTIGDFSKAEHFLNRGLEIEEAVLGENHPDLFCLYLLSK